MKQIFLIIAVLFLFLQYDFCLAQEQITISYQNKEHKSLNITLNGKVKVLTRISHYANDEFCDTIPYYIDASCCPEMQLGAVMLIQCVRDTIIYFFDNKLLLDNINQIHSYMDFSNRLFREETIYNFMKGNLISENTMKFSGIDRNSLTKYEYNSNGNLISELNYYNSFLSSEDSLEYDNHNRLIKKNEYRYIPKHYRYTKKTIQKNKPIYRRKILSKKLVYVYAYKYDTMGNLIEKTFENHFDEVWIDRDIYTYDHNGNKIEEGYCKNKDTNECKYIPLQGFVYDENNRLIKHFYIGKLSPHNIDTYYEYDEKGNKIDEKGYYIKTDTILGYHYVYEYNDNGQQTKDEKKIGDYRSIPYPYHFEKYNTLFTTYDDYKNITQQEYIRDNQTVMIIRYVYSYDSFGNWIKKEKYEGKNEEELSKKFIEERIIEYYQQ